MDKLTMRQEVANMKQFFDRSTQVLTEADSGFAPKPGMFTVAQQVAHAAQTMEWFFEGAFGPSGFDTDFDTMEKAVRLVTSLTAARQWLDRACAAAYAAIDAHSEEEWAATMPEGVVMGGDPRHAIFSGLTDHSAHHRGALTIYSRLLGKEPAMPYF